MSRRASSSNSAELKQLREENAALILALEEKEREVEELRDALSNLLNGLAVGLDTLAGQTAHRPRSESPSPREPAPRQRARPTQSQRRRDDRRRVGLLIYDDTSQQEREQIIALFPRDVKLVYEPFDPQDPLPAAREIGEMHPDITFMVWKVGERVDEMVNRSREAFDAVGGNLVQVAAVASEFQGRWRSGGSARGELERNPRFVSGVGRLGDGSFYPVFLLLSWESPRIGPQRIVDPTGDFGEHVSTLLSLV
jgi:hypothetical protein